MIRFGVIPPNLGPLATPKDLAEIWLGWPAALRLILNRRERHIYPEWSRVHR